MSFLSPTGAAQADLLADLQAVIVQRATDGKGLEAFRRDFKAIMARHGWTGWTGEATCAARSSPRPLPAT